jgi:putative endonuclease
MPQWLDKFVSRYFPRTLGARGERLAAQYAKKTLRFAILARNVRSPDGELDLVALDGQCLVFIEVRTRASDAFGAPERSIRAAKRRFLIRAARWYMRRHRVKNLTPRFDVIAIIWAANAPPVIRHHRGVFGLGH